VGFGQAVCLPVGRRCGDCLVGLEGLCKAADRGKVMEGRKRRVKVEAAVKKEKDSAGDGEKVEVKDRKER